LTPFFRHWKARPAPVAVTLKLEVDPEQTVWDVG
jgi:hypothetical protein